MVCDDVKRFAYFYLDGVLSSQKAGDLAHHLDDCRSCGDRVIIHRRLRLFVQNRLARESAPPSLRDRIHSAVVTSAR